MSIKKIGVNKYKITIELGSDIFGRRKRKTVVFNGNKQEATSKDVELNREYHHIGNITNLHDINFEEYSQIYIEKYCVPNISQYTLHSYKKLLKNINSIIGRYKLKQITPLLLDDMYGQLKFGKSGKELTRNSQYDYYKLVRAMFRKALNWELIDKNPHDKISYKPKGEHKEKKSYDLNQLKELMKALDKECIKYKTLIILALDSGARRSELCALRWKDINFQNKTMNINKALKVIDGVVDEKTTKTDCSKRQIILSEFTTNILKEYKTWQEKEIEKFGQGWKKEDRVFTSKDGGNMNPNTFGQILRKIIKRHNLEYISFHELRHTSATLLISNGIDVETVSKRLGHSDSSITMKVYTHSLESSKNECAKMMNNMLKNPEKCQN